MADGLKYSKVSGVVRWSEGILTLRRGQSIDAEHNLAVERPDLFDDVEPGAEIGGTRVQSTMQRPGETRTEKPPVIQAPRRGSAQ
jgi:hypothetical protein